MPINTDLSARIVLSTESMEWFAMGEASGRRKSLDQADGVATSLVKYTLGSSLNPPLQGQGEEILVLEGALTDGQATYSAGAYLRNPPGPHNPFRTDHGCVLFVKRYPFDSDDTDIVRIDTANSPWVPGLIPADRT